MTRREVPQPRSDPPLVLSVETSCDETSAAVLSGDRSILGHIILSQQAHEVWGGVVPEIAAREHITVLDAVVGAALREAHVELSDIDMFCATAGPGLIGALLVGLTWTKTAAYACGRPFVAVHHMEAHLFAAALDSPDAEPPFVALLVSGGHTMLLWVEAWGDYELLGQTRDDAAGEAFDKVARILGLGFPGGPAIEKAALDGDPASHALPRPMLARNQRPEDPDYFDFSFSGLKTALLTRVSRLETDGGLSAERNNLAASFQGAVVEVLAEKTARAARVLECDRIVLGGGVAANRVLRVSLQNALGSRAVVHVPPLRLATDNAAMVGAAGLFRFRTDGPAPLATTARAELPFPGLKASRRTRAASC